MSDVVERAFPRYPVYLPTKGRARSPLTARILQRDSVPFYLVVEPQEEDAYREAIARESFAGAELLVLPFSNLGLGSIPARNWIIDHAIAAGFARHWQLDDNINEFRRLFRSRRVPCHAGVALRACEDFTDRYSNVAISGLNYTMFVAPGTKKPFVTNVHVYSCTLVNDAIPHRWRGRYNEDTDLCLQVLADGWTTILLNAFMAHKLRTMVSRGGNTDDLYAGDGRLKMARALERAWPGVVTVDRRYGRPQHVIDWTKFTTPLEPNPEPGAPPDYGLRVVAKKPVRSDALRKLLD
jgi:hypothetical protein